MYSLFRAERRLFAVRDYLVALVRGGLSRRGRGSCGGGVAGCAGDPSVTVLPGGAYVAIDHCAGTGVMSFSLRNRLSFCHLALPKTRLEVCAVAESDVAGVKELRLIRVLAMLDVASYALADAIQLMDVVEGG